MHGQREGLTKPKETQTVMETIWQEKRQVGGSGSATTGVSSNGAWPGLLSKEAGLTPARGDSESEQDQCSDEGQALGTKEQ